MSLRRRYSIMCDAPDRPGCLGYYTGDGTEDVAETRRLARRLGWKRIDRPDGWQYGLMRSPSKVDVCPHCATAYGIT